MAGATGAFSEAFAEKKKWKLAAEEYNNALKLRPEDPEPLLESGRVLMRLKRWDQAKDRWSRALALMAPKDPRRVQALERRGAIALREDNITDASRYYLDAIKLAKETGLVGTSTVDAYLGLAYCQEKLKKRKWAIRNYRKALKMSTTPATKDRIRDKLKSLNRPRKR